MARGFKIAEGFVEIEAEDNTHRGLSRINNAVLRWGDRLSSNLKSRFARDGLAAGAEAGTGFLASFGSKISGLLGSNPWLTAAGVVIGAGLAVVAAPAFGAAFAAALLAGSGLGVIGLGAFLLKDEPALVSAAKSLADKVKATFKDVAQPMLQPLISSLKIFEDTIVRIGPKVKEAFAVVAPAIEPLARGLAGLVEKMLPGLVDMLKQSAPLLTMFGEQLPRIGSALSSFFSKIGEAGPSATVFFKDLINVLIGLIVWLGDTTAWLSNAYVSVRGFFTSIPGWISAAITWFTNLKTSVGDWVASVLSWFGSLPGRVGAALAALPGVVLGLILSMINQSLERIGFFIGAAIGFLATLPARAASAIAALPGVVQGLFEQARSLAVSTAQNLVNSVGSFLSQLPGRAASAVSALPGVISNAFNNARNAAVNAMYDLLNSVGSILSGIGSRAANAVGNLGGILYNAGASLIRGLINGVESQLGSLRSALSSVTSLIPDWKGPLDKDKKLLIPAGQAIMGGLIRGLESREGDLRGHLGALTGAIGGMAKTNGAHPPAGSTVNVERVVLDARNVKDFTDVVTMIQQIVPTSRQYRARGLPTPNGAMA